MRFVSSLNLWEIFQLSRVCAAKTISSLQLCLGELPKQENMQNVFVHNSYSRNDDCLELKLVTTWGSYPEPGHGVIQSKSQEDESRPEGGREYEDTRPELSPQWASRAFLQHGQEMLTVYKGP